MPDDLEVDETEPEVTHLFSGAVGLGRALRGVFPARRRYGIKWRWFGHQGFPWCPICGTMAAGSAPYHKKRRKLSPGQQAHEGWHQDLDQLADLLYQVADLLGIGTERDQDGSEQSDATAGDGSRGGSDRDQD